MSDIVLKVEGLTKKYMIGENRERYVALRDVLVRKVRRSVKTLGAAWGNGSRESTPPDNEIYALMDVSFEVRQGEVVGIIGRNGAGKSTLLKILSRITEPTEGRVRIRGRVASLLEVGTGFHPELTGRENIFLNGAVLGMTRQEIRRKFDEIVAFAEVEKFIDTPVKHFSSGMYVRLAFAIAAHLEPEILLVDEVLAVGDAAFQKKCLGKMGDVAKEGRTILFVSHNLTAVRTLCDRAVLLREGRLAADGAPAEVISEYTTALSESVLLREWSDDAPGTTALKITRIRAEGVDGRIDTDHPIEVTIDFKILAPDTRCGFTLMIFSAEGLHILSSMNNNDMAVFGRPLRVGRYRSRVVIPSLLLNAGSYLLSLLVLGEDYKQKISLQNVLGFTVADAGTIRRGYTGHWLGAVRPLLTWATLCHDDSRKP